ITIPNPVPMKISSTADTAMLLVDTIPAAGESVNTSLMAGIGILAAGAAGMAILGTRRKKESDADPR
ncbi:MAG: LPXTG cell wall anchor domain-containing protein, partial [Clostridia bacterium]|nr:LPXTG cell wall anchor domain-containing protein [Clostridia bacterium]